MNKDTIILIIASTFFLNSFIWGLLYLISFLINGKAIWLTIAITMLTTAVIGFYIVVSPIKFFQESN